MAEAKQFNDFDEITAYEANDTLLVNHDPTGDNTLNRMTIDNLIKYGASSVYAYRTSFQSIPNATDTTIIFTTENRDVNSEYNNSTGVFTAKTAGVYLLCTAIIADQYSWADTNMLRLCISKNGSITAPNYPCIDRWVSAGATTSTYAPANGTAVMYLAVGDTLEVKCYHNHGDAINLYSDADGSYVWLTINKIGSV